MLKQSIKHPQTFKWNYWVLCVFVGVLSIILTSCGGSSDSVDSGASAAMGVYPMAVDDNGNGVNDYVERGTHYSGQEIADASILKWFWGVPEAMAATALYNHAFVDNNGDGVCDYAQDGSNTWHGPGFIDENGNGVCDYWEVGAQQYNRNGGIRYQDQNGNGVNDYFENPWHDGNHAFVDGNGDGVCDYAQNGSLTWHGPGFVDADGNGVCDHWQAGGSGYGHWGGGRG